MYKVLSTALVLLISACYGGANEGGAKSAEWDGALPAGSDWSASMQGNKYYLGAWEVAAWDSVSNKEVSAAEWDIYVEVDFDSNGAPSVNVKNSDAVHKCEHIAANNFSASPASNNRDWEGKEWNASWVSASGWEYSVKLTANAGQGGVGVEVSVDHPAPGGSTRRHWVGGVAVESGVVTPPGHESMSYISSSRVAQKFGSGDNCGGSESSWGASAGSGN